MQLNNLEIDRILKKLKLWETPGFFQFIEDLNNLKGKECSIKGEVESLRKIYLKKLEYPSEGKFKQIKMNI